MSNFQQSNQQTLVVSLAGPKSQTQETSITNTASAGVEAGTSWCGTAVSSYSQSGYEGEVTRPEVDEASVFEHVLECKSFENVGGFHGAVFVSTEGVGASAIDTCSFSACTGIMKWTVFFDAGRRGVNIQERLAVKRYI